MESILHIFQFRFDAWNIILPMGISFYTFQAISYIVDVYRGITPVQQQFYKVSIYISFFPQLVAGPIVKANDFLPQLEKEHRIKTDNIAEALQIFCLGCSRKWSLPIDLRYVWMQYLRHLLNTMQHPLCVL